MNRFALVLKSLFLSLVLSASALASSVVNINTADASALAAGLTGVGPAKAQAIVEYRQDHGPFKSADQLASVAAGGPWRDEMALAGNATDARETTLELTWRLPVADWLTLQPDLQYVISPGFDAALDDALVVGLRFELGASWAR